MTSNARKTLTTFAILAMMLDDKVFQVRCRICSAPVDTDKAPVYHAVKTGWVCSNRCLDIYQKEQETQRQKDKEMRDKSVRANMKKFGRGFR